MILENILKMSSGMPADFSLDVGAMRMSLLIFKLYSGISERQVRAIVVPKEYPKTSNLEYPVFFRIKSIVVVISYTPISWKLK